MGMANLNGISIHYRTVGDGNDIVLIHGLAANHGFWGPGVLLPLARTYRVTVLDLRGHGRSTMPFSGYTPAQMAEDLYHLLDHLGIHQADLIGHSFGGVVALQSALLFPERVKSLTLADTRVRALQPIQRSQDWFESEEIIEGLEELGLVIPRGEDEAGLWLLEQLASPRWREVKEKLKKNGAFVPFAGWNGGNRSALKWLDLIRTTRAREEFVCAEGIDFRGLLAIRQPTLVLCGEVTLTKESAEGLRSHLPSCRTTVIPRAGHFFPVTHPTAFVSEVTRFLNEVHRNERRKNERAIVRMPVEVRMSQGACLEATAANVSGSGLLLEACEKLDPGSKIEVLFNLPGSSATRLKGMVVRAMWKSELNLFRLGIRLDPLEDLDAAWDRFLSECFRLRSR